MEYKVEGILSNLRSFGNSSSYLNSIPDETLSTIIRLVVFDTAYSHAFHKVVNEMSHVCKRWRAVAVTDARLWSDLKIEGFRPTPPDALAVYLTRSKRAPLSVSLDITPFVQARMPECTQTLNTHGPRIHILHVHIPPRTSELPAVLTELKAPNVEDLTIACSSVDMGSTLPPCLLGGSLDKVRHISISYFTSWPQGMFSNLFTLDLTEQDPRNKMSLDLFLDMLDASPLLERLHVNQHGPYGIAPRSRVSILPHLSSLELWHCETRSILDHIKIQPSAEVEIHNSIFHIHGSNMDSSSFMDFFQILPNDLSQLGLWEPGESQAFELLFEGGETFRLNIRDPTNREHGLQMYEFLDENLMGLNSKEPEMLSALLFSLQVQNTYPSISSLDIKFDYPLDVHLESIRMEQWSSGLGKFRNLERLVLHECVPANLTAVLQSMVLPRLESLEIRSYAPQSASATVLGLMSRITELVEHRNQAGGPIRELHVSLWCEETDQFCELPAEVEARMLDLSSHGVEKFTFDRERQLSLTFGTT